MNFVLLMAKLYFQLPSGKVINNEILLNIYLSHSSKATPVWAMLRVHQASGYKAFPNLFPCF